MGQVVTTREMVAAMDARYAVRAQIWSEETRRAGLACPNHVPTATFATPFGPPGYMKNRTSRVLYRLKPSFILLGVFLAGLVCLCRRLDGSMPRRTV
ncbi:hypothetical protein GGF32_008464 [Allomyces javanicus]|nr:hypothetical protein GGF32_008464 [Allomyces javanicus]